MRRFLSKLMRDTRTTSKARAARPAARRTSLQVEGLEDRTVLSTASLVGSTLVVNADPGILTIGLPGHPGIRHVRQITFQVDQAQPAKLDVLDDGHLLGRFAIGAIKSASVSVAGLDAVNIDDSRGLPFAAGTSISLFGSSSFLKPNSFNLFGSRTVAGGETYVAGDGAQAGALSLGGSTYHFSSAIGSVSDRVKITAPLFVRSSGSDVTLSGLDGITQTLSGLGSAGGALAYSNKSLVELDVFASADVNLNATKGAAGEQFFVVVMHGRDSATFVNATPSTVTTNAVIAGDNSDVALRANAGRVSVNGISSSFVELGQVVPNLGFSLAFIKANVSVSGVGHLIVADGGNHSTQEHVTVTESTVSGTGLFGSSAVKLTYANVANLELDTGHLADTYSFVGSHPGARFGSQITLNDGSDVGLNVLVALDAGSGLVRLDLLNTFSAHPAPASLFISAPGATFSHPIPTLPAGIEDVFFAGGLTSEVVYNGFTSVSHS
jgi:hypothetical protein